MRSRTWIAVIGLALGVMIAGEAGDAFARARGGGGGSSSGSRGSRSYSAPARPSSPASPTTPSSPSRSLNQPAAPMAPSRPGFFGGMMGGLAGFAIGGLLGSMLFGGMGHGLGGGFGGIGLMDILLIGGGLTLLFMFLRRRRAQEPQPAYAGMGGMGQPYREPAPAPTATVTAAPVEISDVDRGLAHIAQMDGAFDANAVVATARDVFFDVQAALTARDMSRISDKVTPELLADLQRQASELRAAGRTNRVERADVRRSEITEAWQESGRDYVTVYLAGSLLDYTVDDATGNVVSGSSTQRENLEEFWTFSRPVGPNPWRLSAIQTA